MTVEGSSLPNPSVIHILAWNSGFRHPNKAFNDESTTFGPFDVSFSSERWSSNPDYILSITFG